MLPSSRTPRKSETPKTNGGRSAANEKKSVDRSKQPRGKETARKEEDGGGKGVSKGRAKEGAVKGEEKKGERQSRVQTKGQASTGSKKLDGPITRRNSTGASSARKKKEEEEEERNVVDGQKLSIKGEKQVARKSDKKEEESEGGRRKKSSVNSSVENKSRSVISMSRVKTSTPKRNIPRIGSSIGKENAIARYNVSASSRDYSVKSDVSTKGKLQHCASTDLNNNKENKIEKKMETTNETSVAKLEHKSMILGKIEEETMVACKEISRISMNQKALTSSCKKQDEKEASTGKQGFWFVLCVYLDVTLMMFSR